MLDDGRYTGDHVGFSSLGNVTVDENTGDARAFPTSLKPAQVICRSKDHGKTGRRSAHTDDSYGV
jgi:hypothetical protein